MTIPGSVQSDFDLPLPIPYFPISRRPFEFSPGLKKLDVSRTNDATQHLFQVDQQWFHYQQQKQHVLTQSASDYCCEYKLPTTTQQRCINFITQRLSIEHPDYFSIENTGTHKRFINHLSGEKFIFNDKFDLQESTQYPIDKTLLDAVCRQLQEDVCVIQFDDQTDYIAYLHLCFPNHWAAKDKIGQNFIESHAAVPDMDKINRQATPLMQSLLRNSPMERFTWGITNDEILDKHPKYPRPVRSCSNLSEYFLRIERQVMIGFPEVNALLFLIRSYHQPLAQLTVQERQRLAYSIRTMSPTTAQYKGLDGCRDTIISLLDETTA